MLRRATWIVWAVWTALIVLMAGVLGPRHPPVFDEDVPLNRGRLVLAALAVVIFVVCFTPVPITFGEFIGR